jgi:hypothetical protein
MYHGPRLAWGKKVRFYQKRTLEKTRGVAQVIELLPSKDKVLSSSPVPSKTTKINK